MSSLRDDELERILHPVRDEDYMEECAKHHVDIVRTLIGEVEAGVDGRVAESDYWSEMNRLQHWLTDQRGSVEWYTLTEGDLVRLWTDGDPLPFFTSPENDNILCDKYGITRSTKSLSGMLREGLAKARGIKYDPEKHDHTTVSQITREEHIHYIQHEHTPYLIDLVTDMLSGNATLAQEIVDNGRLLGYLSLDDLDIVPKVVLFAHDENWNLINDNPVFHGYVSQTIFVPFTPDHEAYDHVFEDLKEDMAKRCGLTLREGWPKP